MSILGSSCIFPAPDIRKTAHFYAAAFGFQAVEYPEAKESHICLYKDQAEIILLKAKTDRIMPNRVLYGYGYDAYLYVDNPAQWEQKLMAKGINIIRSTMVTDYQNKELVVEDLDGRWLAA